jgi:hypothetical protein
MPESKKQLKRQYQQTPRPMGIFLIRNEVKNKVFLGASLNLPGIINRHKFQLQNGMHANKALQKDWNEFGSNNFSFEIVDELAPRSEPGTNYKEELDQLEYLWLEKLQPFDKQGYNERKQTRAEQLRRIAARHKD